MAGLSYMMFPPANLRLRKVNVEITKEMMTAKHDGISEKCNFGAKRFPFSVNYTPVARGAFAIASR